MLASHVPDECIFFFASFLRCSTYLSATCRRFHLLFAWQYIHIDDSALQRCNFMLPGMDSRFPSRVHPLNLLLLRVLEDHIIPHVHRTKTIIILEPLLAPHTTNIDQQALGYSLGRLLCLAVGVHTYIQKLRESVSIAAGISVFESGVERLCNNGSIRHLYLELGGGLNVKQCHNMFRSLFAGCKTIEQLQIYIPELITVRSFDAEALPWDCFGVFGMLHIGIERIGRHSTTHHTPHTTHHRRQRNQARSGGEPRPGPSARSGEERPPPPAAKPSQEWRGVAHRNLRREWRGTNHTTHQPQPHQHTTAAHHTPHTTHHTPHTTHHRRQQIPARSGG